jgi:exonuclease SbcC
MKPISLTLKGFRGIRDGLGRDELTLAFDALAGNAQLIAIAGSNGRGKTTIMDNMTPYPIMPSRTDGDGLGSFSYYDQVVLPENLKELVWEHDGKCYRTQIVVRLNGKKKTEAYLHMFTADGWMPVKLADGTVSDGKGDTYLRCVEAILGSAETFFTSVFSAQGRRQLSAYRNAEIKTLLADLLGLEEIRKLGMQAADTAKLLKSGLQMIRQERTGLQLDADQIAHELSEFGDLQRRIAIAGQQKAASEQALDAAKETLVRLLSLQEGAQQTEARRSHLQQERQAIIESGKAALVALNHQMQREADRLGALDRRKEQRRRERATKRMKLVMQRNQLGDVVRQGSKIERATHRMQLAAKIVSMREATLARSRRSVEQFNELIASEKILQTKIAAIEREAGQAALNAQDLARRFGLTTEVPCAGTDLQGHCKLLADALNAKSLMPSASLQMARLEDQRGTLNMQLSAIRRQAAGLAGAQDQCETVQRKLHKAKTNVSEYALLNARRGELLRAIESLATIEQEIRDLTKLEVDETDEEKADRRAIADTMQHITAQRICESNRHRESLDRIEAALAALPAPFDGSQVQQAQLAVTRMRRLADEAESTLMAVMHDQQRTQDATQRQMAIAQRIKQIDSRCTAIDESLGVWTLFAKCMGNDGLIALSIDDAGPTLSGLANDLLFACYGPRFAVSIKTLVENGKGEQREGFDIIVHDADSGDAKSVTAMSGGERVWINECLTRAIALYLAQHSGRRYGTLFSDEADGPLDAERKRMFMAMKREVLRIGRYGREYFVSQTPALTAMADAVIDLEKYVATVSGSRQNVHNASALSSQV